MKTVFVGLSGGVDSAVSAALLKDQGYNVVGAFIKIWRPEFIECTWKEDRLDAMRVAATLQIPFREIDLSEEYRREVIDTMIENYQKGATPNPDVLCNTVIKFGSFYKWARSQGADIVATGHYAQVKDGRLYRGVDDKKDQSYFLHHIDADHLQNVMFPVGNYRKNEIRALAKKFGLPNAERPDSQGLCFVGDITLPEFLARFISLEEGNVLDGRGVVIGTHSGAALYTVSQRHGFTSRSSVPLFVTHVDTKTNTIHVSARKEDATCGAVDVQDIHWIRKPNTAELIAQTRYRESPVRIHLEGTHVAFAEPHIAAKGQSIVFYEGDECLGGGTIV